MFATSGFYSVIQSFSYNMFTTAFLQSHYFSPPATTENIRGRSVLPPVNLHGYILTEIQSLQHIVGSYKEAETLANKKLNLLLICLNM